MGAGSQGEQQPGREERMSVGLVRSLIQPRKEPRARMQAAGCRLRWIAGSRRRRQRCAVRGARCSVRCGGGGTLLLAPGAWRLASGAWDGRGRRGHGSTHCLIASPALATQAQRHPTQMPKCPGTYPSTAHRLQCSPLTAHRSPPSNPIPQLQCRRARCGRFSNTHYKRSNRPVAPAWTSPSHVARPPSPLLETSFACPGRPSIWRDSAKFQT